METTKFHQSIKYRKLTYVNNSYYTYMCDNTNKYFKLLNIILKLNLPNEKKN